jgi:hypothetical protein
MKNLAPILLALASGLTCIADAAGLPLLEQVLQPLPPKLSRRLADPNPPS